MAARIESWSDGALRRYWLYLTAALFATPAAVAYGTLAAHGIERWWTVLPVLLVGVALADRGWHYANRRIEALSSLHEEFSSLGLDDRVLYQIIALVGTLVVSEQDFRE